MHVYTILAVLMKWMLINASLPMGLPRHERDIKINPRSKLLELLR